VINLRGGFDASFYALEKDACERLGLTLVDFTVTSREAPVQGAHPGRQGAVRPIAYPALMHCKSGADRAGIMSVLYRHFRLGEPIRVAMDQLHIRYLHIRTARRACSTTSSTATSRRRTRRPDLPRVGRVRRLRPRQAQGRVPRRHDRLALHRTPSTPRVRPVIPDSGQR
jgi:hypothetical protein